MFWRFLFFSDFPDLLGHIIPPTRMCSNSSIDSILKCLDSSLAIEIDSLKVKTFDSEESRMAKTRMVSSLISALSESVPAMWHYLSCYLSQKFSNWGKPLFWFWSNQRRNPIGFAKPKSNAVHYGKQLPLCLRQRKQHAATSQMSSRIKKRSPCP